MSEDTDAEIDDTEQPNFAPNATFTYPDGTTTTTKDFDAFDMDVSLDDDMDGMSEVSAGLSEAIEDAQQEFQLTVEVPTRTLVCPNCDHLNEIPVWAFVKLDFRGDLEPLSGEYALGHQCNQCGFPY